jgi:hypothetical protein
MPPIDIFQVYNDLSAPGADDYLIDADRSTLRLSTGYPTTFKKNPASGVPASCAQNLWNLVKLCKSHGLTVWFVFDI